MQSPLAFVLLALAIHPPPAAPPRPVATPEALAPPVHFTKPPQANCDSGRTPIAGPTTITEPGSYYLVADVVSSEGSAIVILADDVTLDLNGHRVSAPIAPGVDVVLVEDGAEGTLIRNGRIFGGHSPLHARSSTGHVRLKLETLDIATALIDDPDDSRGVLIEGAERVEILESSIEAPTSVLSVSGLFDLVLIRNRFKLTWSLTEIALLGVRGGLIEGNEIIAVCAQDSHHLITALDITGGGLFARGGLLIKGNSFLADWCDFTQLYSGIGIWLRPQGRNAPTAYIVEGNSIVGYPMQGVLVESTGNMIRGNTIWGQTYGGIDIHAPFNEIRGNQIVGVGGGGGGIYVYADGCRVVDNSMNNGGNGITVYGKRNLIENNHIESDYGLRLVGSSNIYRGNVVHSLSDTGTGNIDAGGNVISP